MTKQKSKLTDLELQYNSACFNDDINTFIELYNQYHLKHNKIKSFISFLYPSYPFLNSEKACKTAFNISATYERYNVLNFLLKQDKVISACSNEDLTHAIDLAMSRNNLDLVKTVFSFIKDRPGRNEQGHIIDKPYVEQETFHEKITVGFDNACENGYLDIVEYIATRIETDKYAYIPTKSLMMRGFIKACESGQLDIVKFFTRSPNLKIHINLNKIDRSINIESTEIIHYFLFDLGLKRDSYFMSKIKPQLLIDKVFEYHEVTEELPKNNDGKNIKRIKI
jgi:hypothetical protein